MAAPTVTTDALGEEGPWTTDMLGEEGPWTTAPLGEEATTDKAAAQVENPFGEF